MTKDRGKIGVLGAAAIGVGGMVGGGIFAVLGTAVGQAGGATPIAFLLAGVVALITAYSYAKLSVAPELIAKAEDYALAEAARPSLGQPGFILVSISALLATFSAINATLYGDARIGYLLAKDGELPEPLEKRAWGRPVEGVLITAGLSLLLANLVDLTAIAIVGSAGFLLIFAAVKAAAWKLADRIGARRFVAGAGIVACLSALAALLFHTRSLHAALTRLNMRMRKP